MAATGPLGSVERFSCLNIGKYCGTPHYYKNCIFQDVWREYASSYLVRESGDRSYGKIAWQHVSFLTRLLLDCLLAHRFRAAAQILEGLFGGVSCTKKMPVLLWKVGSEVMQNITGSHSHLVQFYQSMIPICARLSPQVVLNFSLYLITRSKELTEGYELLNIKSGQRPFSGKPMLLAHLGMFEFILWKKNKVKLHSQEQQDDTAWDRPFDQSTDAIERQMKFHGNKALLCFDQLVENSGVWDIFISKQVELLQYYDKQDEARNILQRYKEKNPENPNAHRYLYNFLKSEEAKKEELCRVLEPLLLLDPSSELTQEYTTLKLQLGSPVADVLPVLFNKLDHAASRDCPQSWNSLAQHLKNVHSGDPNRDIWQLWDERSDWWPQYHFRLDQVPLKSHSSPSVWSVVADKARVADVLLGNDNSFSRAVRKQENRTRPIKQGSADFRLCEPSDASGPSELASPRKRARRKTSEVSSKKKKKIRIEQ